MKFILWKLVDFFMFECYWKHLGSRKNKTCCCCLFLDILMQISYILWYLRLVLKSLEVWSKLYFLYELGRLPLFSPPFHQILSLNTVLHPSTSSLWVKTPPPLPPSLPLTTIPPSFTRSLLHSASRPPRLSCATLYLDRSLDVRMRPCRLAALLGLLVLCKGKNDSNTSADVWKKTTTTAPSKAPVFLQLLWGGRDWSCKKQIKITELYFK